ncbi:MAG TPA: molecular chaperone DnaJ [Candidatus Nanoarchaeia archaeon]|nr:molecular chaperone DnaJ [Candidatus Nanoarchaeia archaeon]
MAEDYYETLGVSKNSSKEEIKKAYKNLAKKYHPDVSKDHGDGEKFKKISEAYAVLGDDTKKAQYDQYGEAGFHQRYSQEDIFRGFDINDIFGDFFGGDNPFEMFFSGGSRRRTKRGRDLRYELSISFEEASLGTTKEIEVERLLSCEECHGTGSDDGKLNMCENCNGAGQVRTSRRTPFGSFTQVTTCEECNGEGKTITHPCKKCSGSGRIKKIKTIKINIPAGVDNGSQLKISREGEAGLRGSNLGDLYVVIHVKPSEIFHRREYDLILEVPITISQAALGDEIKVPTLDKEVSIKIPEGTQPGTQFRLKGKGVPYVDGYGRGDLYVIANVAIPKKVNKEQKKIFEELKKSEEKKSLIERIKEFAKERL